MYVLEATLGPKLERTAFKGVESSTIFGTTELIAQGNFLDNFSDFSVR